MFQRRAELYRDEKSLIFLQRRGGAPTETDALRPTETGWSPYRDEKSLIFCMAYFVEGSASLIVEFWKLG